MSENASKRAREIDRATTATALDRAYSDGQMTYEEHRLRIERCRAAITLRDLRALTDDLQSDVDLPEPPPRHYEPKRRVLYALLAVIVVAVGLTVFLLDSRAEDEPILAAAPTSSTSTPVPEVEVGEGVTPIVARPFVFDTAAGLDDFRQQYIDRFGSSEIISVRIQMADQRADIYRFDADRAVEDVTVYGGFDPGPYSSSSLNDAATFDWMSLDHTLVANLLAGVPQSLQSPDAVVESLTVDNQEQPEIEFRTVSSGRIVFDFAGNTVGIYR